MSKDLGDLSAAELEVLAMLRDETTVAHSTITLANGNKQVVTTAAEIEKVREYLTDPPGNCELVPGIPYANMIRAYVCNHGTVHIGLYDKADAPFVLADMQPEAWIALTNDVVGQFEAQGMVEPDPDYEAAPPENQTRH